MFVQPRLEKIIAVLTVRELLMKKVVLADMQIAGAKQAFRKQFEICLIILSSCGCVIAQPHNPALKLV